MKQTCYSVLLALGLGLIGPFAAQGDESYTILIRPGSNLIANQLEQGGNTLNEVMPVVPDGSQVFAFAPGTGSFVLVGTYSSLTASWSPGDYKVVPGTGFKFENNSGSAFPLTFTGLRRLAGTIPPLIPELYRSGLSLVGAQVPMAGTIDLVLGTLIPCGRINVSKPNPATGGLDPYEYDLEAGGWTPSIPTVAVGEAVWLAVDPESVCPGTPPFFLSCPLPKTVQCGSGWDFDPPFAINSCQDLPPTITELGTVTNGVCPAVISRTWQAIDACGRSQVCSQTVTVSDPNPVPLELMCAADKTVECTAPWSFDPPTPVNPCQPPPPVLALAPFQAAQDPTPVTSVLNTVTNGLCPMMITRTWEVIDACGKRATCSQTVTVTDTTAPELICAADKTVECGAEWSFDEPTVSDTCSGETTVITLDTITNGVCPMVIVRTYEAIDACGNRATCSQTVTIADTTAPQLRCAADKTVECGAEWSFDAPTVTDSCDGSPTVNVLSTVTNGVCPVVITRTWEALDACGNRATCSQNVNVTDTTPPQVHCAADKTVECGAEWSFDAPTVADSCDGSPTISVLNTVTNGTCPATIIRTWEVLDACGNRATCSQTVSVAAAAKGDLWVEDTPYNYIGAPDLGGQPDRNMDSQQMWLSRAIWVHQTYNVQPAGTYLTHQNPRFGQTNGILVKVGNLSSGLVNGAQLNVYVANASLGLSWPESWKLVGIYELPAIPSGDSHIAELPWRPEGTGHYCLLARIVSEQDPMFRAEGQNIGINVRYNNNLAWRNVNVVNLLVTTGQSAEVRVKPVKGTRPPVAAKALPRPGEKPPRQPVSLRCKTEALFHEGAGEASVNLGPWFKRWQDAGGRGQGFTIVGDTTVRFNDVLGRIEDIPLDEDEEAIFNLVLVAPHPMPVAGTEHTCHVELTEEINGEDVGGVNYGVLVRALHTDTDKDGIVDAEDPDDDGDGVPDVDDPDPLGEPDCPPSAITIRYVDGNTVLSWNGLGYRLEASSDIERAWHPLNKASSPYLVAPTEDYRFFRLVCH